MSPEAYARALKKMLPPGSLWNLLPGAVLSRVLLMVGDSLARVDARAVQLMDEADPRTAVETLPEWERVLGLPDEGTTEIPDTVEARQLAVVAKFIRQGGQSRPYFTALAAACGYAVTVVDDYGLTVARAGRARAGTRARGPQWAHVWRVEVQPPTGPSLSHEDLEANLRRAAPAHTVVRFVYA